MEPQVNENICRDAWDLLKQMVDYYTHDKKYLTKREINYIIRFCENKDRKGVLIDKVSKQY